MSKKSSNFVTIFLKSTNNYSYLSIVTIMKKIAIFAFVAACALTSCCGKNCKQEKCENACCTEAVETVEAVEEAVADSVVEVIEEVAEAVEVAE